MNSSRYLPSLIIVMLTLVNSTRLLAIKPLTRSASSAQLARTLVKKETTWTRERAASDTDLSSISSVSDSGSDSSDGDNTPPVRLKQKYAAGGRLPIAKKPSIIIQIETKLAFLRDIWNVKRERAARQVAAARARSAGYVPTAASTLPEVSPLVVPSVGLAARTQLQLASKPIDLGDAVPSESKTVRSLDLSTTRAISRTTPRSPTSPELIRVGCLDMWFEKRK